MTVKQFEKKIGEIESKLNDLADEAESLKDEAEEFFDDHGEKWQEGDTGQEWRGWIDNLETAVGAIRTAADEASGVL